MFPAFRWLRCCVLAVSASACGLAVDSLQLEATLTTPTEIKLAWKNPDARAAGHIVEYDTDPSGEFVILGFCPAGQSEFVHPRLVPHTKFYYRVRPYFGAATAPVEVTVAAGASDEAYAAAYALSEDYRWAAPEKLPQPEATPRVSLRQSRDAAGDAAALPTGLRAEVMTQTISGFRLAWTDRTTDEEGFLIEKKQPGGPGYFVCAMVEPDVNSFGWAFEPPERRGAVRIRAFYFGAPSPVVGRTTGAGPPDADEDQPHR